MPTNKRFALNQGAAGTTEIAAAVPGNRHEVMGFVLNLGNNGTFKFTDGAGDLMGPVFQASNQTPFAVISPIPIVQTGINSPLNIVTTGGAGRGVIMYMTEP